MYMLYPTTMINLTVSQTWQLIEFTNMNTFLIEYANNKSITRQKKQSIKFFGNEHSI